MKYQNSMSDILPTMFLISNADDMYLKGIHTTPHYSLFTIEPLRFNRVLQIESTSEKTSSIVLVKGNVHTSSAQYMKEHFVVGILVQPLLLISSNVV